jgi:hypothetical protein
VKFINHRISLLVEVFVMSQGWTEGTGTRLELSAGVTELC